VTFRGALIVVIALSMAIAAFLLARSMGVWSGTSPEPAAASASPAPQPTPSERRAAAWALADTRAGRASPPASPTPARSATDDDASCGPSHQSCPVDSACIGGRCVLLTCGGDGGDGNCALAGGGAGACCGDRCVDLAHDGANCGQCGARCPPRLDCVNGTCLAATCLGRMAGTGCSNPGHGESFCCRGTCLERAAWSRDTANCGGCGHACAPGLDCRNGQCVDPNTGTRPSWTCLSEGHGCPPGSFCLIDACFPRVCAGDNDGVLCPLGNGADVGHCCGKTCSDLFEDHDNCGGCGVTCAPAERCVSGECGAPPAPKP
jgi:hypothetical protein